MASISAPPCAAPIRVPTSVSEQWGDQATGERSTKRHLTRASVAPRLLIRPGLQVDVHEMVRHAVLLRQDHDQLLVEVRGGDQLDGVSSAMAPADWGRR